MDKTHFRKAFNSPYLSSADIVSATQLTVKCVKLEKDRTRKTKDSFNTAYFVQKEIRPGEPLKPMILNATNSKMMKELTGSPFIDDWNNVSVTVYVDPSVRFGRETVEGLRITKGESSEAQAVRDELSALYEQRKDELSAAQVAYFEQTPIEKMSEREARTVLERMKAA